MKWLSYFNQTSCHFLTKVRSDHFPLNFNFNFYSISIACKFKFKYIWTTHPLCLDIVKTSQMTKVSGFPMFILYEKLKLLQKNMKIWNKDIFGNTHKLVNEEGDKFNIVQGLIQIDGYTEALRYEEKLCFTILEDALHQEHLFQKEKAKVNWHLEGDENTKYFHRIVKIKNSINNISSLNINGEIISDKGIIGSHVVEYYNNIFTSLGELLLTLISLKIAFSISLIWKLIRCSPEFLLTLKSKKLSSK